MIRKTIILNGTLKKNCISEREWSLDSFGARLSFYLVNSPRLTERTTRKTVMVTWGFDFFRCMSLYLGSCNAGITLLVLL